MRDSGGKEVLIHSKPERKCSNALPFNLVHFPEGDYPGKLTQREIISEEQLSEHLDCLSEQQRARQKLQKTILLTISQ